MKLAAVVTQFFYAQEVSPEAQRWYRQKLSVFRDWCYENGVEDARDITKDTVRDFLRSLNGTSEHTGKPLSQQTKHGYARAVRAFLNYCEEDNHIDRAPDMRKMMPKRDTYVKDVFMPQEIDALLRACKEQDDRMLAYRDRAIVMLLLDSGIRAGELLSLTLEKVQFSISECRIVVSGKGRKQRPVWLGKQARLALHRYVTEFRPAHTEYKNVFLTRRATPLQYVGLVRTLQRLSRISGVDVHSNPHKFRHTYAYLYLKEKRGDLMRLSRLLGHSSVVVTEEYLKMFGATEAADGGSVLDGFRFS